ncbi:MAG: hypothetical protein R3F11_20355 [Verrucomicrobiales bacterium]
MNGSANSTMRDVWFRFTATEPVHGIEIRSDELGIGELVSQGIILAVRTSAAGGQIFSQQPVPRGEVIYIEGLTPGNDYFVQVGTFAAETGGFEIAITETGALAFTGTTGAVADDSCAADPTSFTATAAGLGCGVPARAGHLIDLRQPDV